MLRLALLLAVPADWLSFQRAAYNPQREWLRRFAADPERPWREGYAEDVAAPVSRLIDEARALGVEVLIEARLADLADATRSCDAVIVLAHWKGPTVTVEDLIEPRPALLADRLAAHGGMAGLAADLAPARSAAEAAARLQAHVASGTAAGTVGGAFTVRAHPGTVAALRRGTLDAALAGLLRPGNRLELSDGLFDAQAVDSVMDPDFEGVLDLSACQARSLADHIDRERLGRCGVVQFEGDLIPEVAALALFRTFQRCAAGATDYLRARQQALDELWSAMDAEVQRDTWSRVWARLARAGLWGRR